jgi:beta-N-acetylhexosaminidase
VIARLPGIAATLVALALAATGCGGKPDPGKPPAAAAPPSAHPAAAADPAAGVPLDRLIGQKLVVVMDGKRPSRDLLRRIRQGHVGGVVLLGPNIGSDKQVRALARKLRRTARAGGATDFLVAVDQEGGPVRRLSGAPRHSPVEIGASNSRALALREGAATGSRLRSLAIDVDLAPVLDVGRRSSFMASRGFGKTPKRVAKLGSEFAVGLQREGVAATAKHFPGLGHSDQNTDFGVSVVTEPRASLDADLEPFKTAIARDVKIVMMSTAVYRAYDKRRPAALSRPIVTGVLRERLGFDGVIATDTLGGAAVRAVTSPPKAAVAAARAGVDVVLVGGSERASKATYRAMLAAARDGRLDKGALSRSYARIAALQQWLRTR